MEAKPAHDFLDFLNGISTAVIALATIVNVIITSYLYKATRTAAKAAGESVKAAQDGFNIAQRAYLYCHGITPSVTTTNSIRFDGSIQNGGNPPATHIEVLLKAFYEGSEAEVTRYDQIRFLAPGRGSVACLDFAVACDYPGVIDGTRRMEIQIDMTYRSGSSGIHHYSQKFDNSKIAYGIPFSTIALTAD